VAAPPAEVNAFAAKTAPPMLLLADTDGVVTLAHHAVAELINANGRALLPARTIIVADAGQRVLAIFGRGELPPTAGEVVTFLEEVAASNMPRQQKRHAPVLVIPRVLSPAFCKELIAVWETQGNEESGFMRQVDGQTVGVHDYGQKIRRDHFLTEGPIKQRAMHYIYHRVRPLIRQAFNFDVTRFEDFRIACYDSSRGGYFRPHRDNTTTGTAHRVFAMSLNLNEGEYEGGFLRFPEFGQDGYRPGIGEAVVFSCSLLHEATDVSAGRRFVLLTFLYGEREGRARQEVARRGGISST
jgi:hypothetical protein